MYILPTPSILNFYATHDHTFSNMQTFIAELIYYFISKTTNRSPFCFARPSLQALQHCAMVMA